MIMGPLPIIRTDFMEVSLGIIFIYSAAKVTLARQTCPHALKF